MGFWEKLFGSGNQFDESSLSDEERFYVSALRRAGMRDEYIEAELKYKRLRAQSRRPSASEGNQEPKRPFEEID